MRTVISRDEEESAEQEITLSTGSLLGLFLGLVLVCGVFFGFGYSVGRRATATGLPAAPGNDANAADDEGAILPKIWHSAKPSGARTEDAPADNLAAEPPSRTEPVAEPITLPVVETPAAPPKVSARNAEPAAGAESAVKRTAGSAESAQAMVQVAAVVHQEDADVLVSALRRLGYSAVVRNEAQDKLLHVQVGPFATRAMANQMKQQLASDGYKAIIKQ
ncbi:MAG TPA: SPOR domain-containing protein [Acidobacteriaceae bacterium]|nr:SPOR domain-containing protein [Acidobacteriaceae bacterium]